MPPRPYADFELSQDKKFLFVASIQANNLGIYYQSFDQLNFDDSIDTVPSQGVQVRKNSKPDIIMQPDPPVAVAKPKNQTKAK